MDRCSSAAAIGSTWLLMGIACLVLMATSCGIASYRGGEAARAAATPMFDALDPCAGAPAGSTSNPGTPEATALSNLHTWSDFPMRDSRARIIVNDGSFARVVVCAQVRHGPNDAWDEFSGEYALSLLRGQWTIQESPFFRFNGFVSVKGEATRQTAERAATELTQVAERTATEKLQAALLAREAIRATVVGITEVRDIPQNNSYSKVTLELQSTDGKEHRVAFSPTFRATMQQCAAKSLEGGESIMSIDLLFSAQPKETIGPVPIQRDYAFKAEQNPWHGVFARTGCQILTDARDLQLTIYQIDGFDAYQLESAERQLADATATPTPSPTVVAVATEVTTQVVPSPTMVPPVEASPANASGGVSVSAILWNAGAALIGIMVVSLAVLSRRIATIRRRAPREHYAETVREYRGSRSQGDVPADSRIELAQDDGHVATAPRSVTVVEARLAPLTVKCFGGLQVACADRLLWPARELAQEQRAWELLFFLAASPPEGVDREAVTAALWPDVDLADAAGSLRQLRRRLRLMLVRAVPGLPEGAPLEADTGRLYRLATGLVCSDAHRFTDLLRVARSEGRLALGTLEQAYGLYEADLLDSPQAPPFAWAIDPGEDGTSLRQRYRKQFLDMCRTLADLHVAGGEGAYVERAVDLYRRLVQVDPMDERTWRALLSAHAKRRDRTGVDREWQRLIDALRAADSAATPEAETSALYQRLRMGE
jgi:DNA-binding SARP family transcriptional activator